MQDILQDDNAQLTLGGDDDLPNKLALDEVGNHIEKSTQRNIPVTMKSLLDLYTKAPYGWLENDIRGLVLRLFKSQEIKLQLSGEYLSPTDKDLVQYTIKKDYTDRLIIKKRTKTPEKLLQNARKLIKEVFNVAAVPDDEDGLMQRFKELSRDELGEIKELLVHYKNEYYPDKKVLEEGKALFEEIFEIKDVLQFYEKLSELKEELLDYEENIIDVKNFFKNQQGYFDRALQNMDIYEKNKSYVLDNETIQTVKEVQDIIYAAKPYTKISKLPELLDDFRSKFVKLLEKEIEPVRSVIESDRKKVMEELEKHSFKDELSSRFHDSFKDLLERLEACNDFYQAIAMKEESDRLKLRCFDHIEKIRQEKEREEQGREKVKTPPKKVVTVSIANIFHGARTLESREDVEQLLNYLRQQLLSKLQENTRVKLI